MGLALEVGMLANLLKSDEEGAEYFQGCMERLNTFLPSKNLQPHIEPKECKVFSCDMYGYSGLHYLRRIAVYLDLRSELPTPGDKKASKDPLVQDYYQASSQSKPSFMERLFKNTPKKRAFDHLMLHSDSEGYYLPQDFEAVLFPPKSLNIPGAMVGSSSQLQAECKRLAAALELPLDLDPESEIVNDATNSQGKGQTQWQRYGIESYVCLQLLRAAEHSIKNGAAIVFC